MAKCKQDYNLNQKWKTSGTFSPTIVVRNFTRKAVSVVINREFNRLSITLKGQICKKLVKHFITWMDSHYGATYLHIAYLR